MLRRFVDDLPRHLATHLLGLFGAGQMALMIAGHAGWMIMCVIGLQEGAGGHHGRTAAGLLIGAYAALGGVDEDGHGDLSNLLGVAAKLSLVVWVLEFLWEKLRGERVAWRFRTKLLLSAGVAVAGYATAAALIGLDAVVMVALAIATIVGSAWGLAIDEALRRFRKAIWRKPIVPAPVATQHP